jgi:hypothetical protein
MLLHIVILIGSNLNKFQLRGIVYLTNIEPKSLVTSSLCKVDYHKLQWEV